MTVCQIASSISVHFIIDSLPRFVIAFQIENLDLAGDELHARVAVNDARIAW
jgi:hypothetical protein